MKKSLNILKILTFLGLDIGKFGICGVKMESRCQCAAASCVRDGSRPPATGLQEQVANPRKRLWLRALVVSVTEKGAIESIRCGLRRRIQVNHRASVESLR